MRVYVATKFEDSAVASYWLDRLRKQGIDISHDWTAVEEIDDLVNQPITRRRYAEDDFRGVACADLVWVLAPKEGGRGCWTEMGFAIALQIPVFVSGEGVGKNLFDAFASCSVTHEQAFADILKIAGR